MYEAFYQLTERAFSITPNPRFVFLGPHHQDALAHLLYGIGQGGSGGFVQLTGEVGTGKTTLCRLMLEEVPEKTHIALILNPMLSPSELVEAICTELEIELDGGPNYSLLTLQNRLIEYLLSSHSRGERVVVVIDEAQNLSEEALEQVRLLTNLETATDKLLQIILIGQPELREVLKRPSLRQLAQRITARYHLEALNCSETHDYVRHRLMVAGAPRCPFTQDALDALFEVTLGVPRLINIIADRALLAGYTLEQAYVDRYLVRQAADEVNGITSQRSTSSLRDGLAFGGIVALVVMGLGLVWMLSDIRLNPGSGYLPRWEAGLLQGPQTDGWTEGAALWSGVTPDQVARACENRGEVGTTLVCMSLRGTWRYLSSVDLPVLLRLHQTQQRYVLLTRLSEQEVVFQYQGQAYTVAKDRLDRYWQGEFLAIWPDRGLLWSLGDESPEIATAKRLATQWAKRPWQGDQSERFGSDFEAWVMQFQGEVGLMNDGVIGPATRLFLGFPQAETSQRALMPLTLSGDEGS
jgi:general secretion pathway protein A